jgi:hypothetical protein
VGASKSFRYCTNFSCYIDDTGIRGFFFTLSWIRQAKKGHWELRVHLGMGRLSWDSAGWGYGVLGHRGESRLWFRVSSVALSNGGLECCTNIDIVAGMERKVWEVVCICLLGVPRSLGNGWRIPTTTRYL